MLRAVAENNLVTRCCVECETHFKTLECAFGINLRSDVKATSQVAQSVLPTLSATGARADAQAFGLLAELDGRTGTSYSPRGDWGLAGRWVLALVMMVALGGLIMHAWPVPPSLAVHQVVEVRAVAPGAQVGGDAVLVPRTTRMDGTAVIETLPLAEDPTSRGQGGMPLQDGVPTSAPVTGAGAGVDTPTRAASGPAVAERASQRDVVRSVAGSSHAADSVRIRAVDPVDPDVEVISAIVQGAEQARTGGRGRAPQRAGP